MSSCCSITIHDPKRSRGDRSPPFSHTNCRSSHWESGSNWSSLPEAFKAGQTSSGRSWAIASAVLSRPSQHGLFYTGVVSPPWSPFSVGHSCTSHSSKSQSLPKKPDVDGLNFHAREPWRSYHGLEDPLVMIHEIWTEAL